MLTGPIVPVTSPLRRVPEKLNHRQRLFVDGIRCSIEMADVAFTRLCHTALAIGENSVSETPQSIDPSVLPASMLDAWSVVDSVHRVRVLIDGFPRLNNFVWKELFIRQTESVKALRNSVQHLLGEYNPDAEANDLPWGQLSWISGPHAGGVVCIPMLVSGAIAFKTAPGARKPKSFQSPLDRVVLSAFGLELNLSETMTQVERMAEHLSQAWESAVKELGPQRATDLIACAQFREAPDHALREQNGI